MRSGLMMGEGVLRSSVPFLILFLKKIKENYLQYLQNYRANDLRY